jgi:hypothetical protein
MPLLTFALSPAGPVIDVLVGVSPPRAQQLALANAPVPAPVSARLLVDTGASVTCLDRAILASLGLAPTGNVAMATPSTGATRTSPHSSTSA